ncbi:hypothetical protein BC941DRAFT_419151 [Chlamydoabsidia padenii]|nr:hypothetical protein BC941DRAFT_419151 [Chlamydoabsidia padenii]
METSHYRSRQPQSTTHRSPELPHPSLTSFAQSYEPTAAQKFVQEQRQKTLSSSTVVDSTSTTSSSPSLFGSALSADDPLPPLNHQDSPGNELVLLQTTQDEELLGYRRTPRHGSALDDNDDDDDDDDDDEHKNGNIGSSQSNGIWQEYQPDYGMLNESYQTTKRNMYKDIELTLRNLQQLETRLEISKEQFHSRIEKEYETWSLQLDDQRRVLSQRKQEADEQKPQSLTTFPNKIRLNVGGDIFETSLKTLKRDQTSLLAVMFSGKHPIEPDSEGSYFIDRDPTHFRLILNYLRDLRISPAVLQDELISQELLQEAQFYGINDLVKLLQQ